MILPRFQDKQGDRQIKIELDKSVLPEVNKDSSKESKKRGSLLRFILFDNKFKNKVLIGAYLLDNKLLEPENVSIKDFKMQEYWY